MQGMKLILLGLASASLRLGAKKAQHQEHRDGFVMVGGCKVQGPGAVQTAAGGGSHGTLDGVEPFMNVYRDGYWSVGCISDEMVKSGDKFGDGKFDYKIRESANTSLVYYSEIVEGDKKESMTPKVCFEFCRTMPDMQFFGLIYGRECYCEHYYKKTTGEGTCDLPCEGSASSICGGKQLSSIYQMHACEGGLAADMADLSGEVDTTIDTLTTAHDDVDAIGAAMQSSAEKLESYAEGCASSLNQAAKVAAGPLIHAADDCMELSEEMSTASGDYDGLGLSLTGTLSFDDRKAVEEYMEKAKSQMDAAEQAIAAAKELADESSPDVAEYDPTFVPVMRQITPEMAPKMSVCNGEMTGLPKVGLSLLECADACDMEAPKASEDYCMYYQYFEFSGEEQPLCFLFSEITEVTTFNCDYEERELIVPMPEKVELLPPGVTAMIESDKRAVEILLQKKHHRHHHHHHGHHHGHKTAHGLRRNKGKKSLEEAMGKAEAKRFLLSYKTHFKSAVQRSTDVAGVCMVRLADTLGVTPDPKDGITNIDRCFGSE
jgi:hypothetical protein